MQLKAKAKSEGVRGQSQGQTFSRPRLRPEIFVLVVSSRSGTVFKDSIPSYSQSNIATWVKTFNGTGTQSNLTLTIRLSFFIHQQIPHGRGII